MNKKSIIIMTFLILSMILVSVPSYAQNNLLEKQDKKIYEILFKTKDIGKRYSTQSLYKEETAEIPKINVKKIKVETEEEYLKLLEKLKADPNIEYAEPNIKYHKMQIPNDTYINEDWAIECINAPLAWDFTVGTEETTIAVIDTGVELDNPELISNLVQGYDFVNSDYYPDDDDGHGTLVAQVIGAKANNNLSSAGVTWNNKIMPLKVLDENGDGYVEDIADAIVYATDNGVKIINLSLGGPSDSNTIYNAVQYANEHDVLIIAASGNAYDDTKYNVYFPAAYPEVIAVGAIDENKILADFSCRGISMSMVAPGVNIIGYQGGDNIIADGTSFSAPYVSGAAALVWAINPDLTNNQVREILESTTTDIGKTGWDEEYGYGVLNIYEAVKQSINQLYSQEKYAYGDYNRNGIIDIFDIVKIAKKLGLSIEDVDYLDIYDINNDKIINILDLNIQGLNYGRIYNNL